MSAVWVLEQKGQTWMSTAELTYAPGTKRFHIIALYM